MRILLLTVSFVFLGIIPPALLTAIATPWDLGSILAGWTLFALVAYPLWWVAMGRRMLV